MALAHLLSSLWICFYSKWDRGPNIEEYYYCNLNRSIGSAPMKKEYYKLTIKLKEFDKSISVTPLGIDEIAKEFKNNRHDVLQESIRRLSLDTEEKELVEWMKTKTLP